MVAPPSEIDTIRQQGILASVAGFPFLLVFGVVWLSAGALSYWVPLGVAPWLYPFLGGLGMPVAMAVERRVRYVPPAKPDPLLPLTLQLLFVQIVAFPAVFLVWDATPHFMPVAFAAVVGAHFLPFQWVYRTKVYGVLAIAVAVGPFVLAVLFGQRVLHYTGFFVGGVLLVGAFLVRSHAAATWREFGQAAAQAHAADGTVQPRRR
jgi:hypothetical protein